MVKNIYFFYLFLLNALINLVNYVPRILIHDRYNGAVLSVIISIPVGLLLLYLFAKMIGSFPQQGLPEIINSGLPRWFGKLLLLLLGCIWFMSSVITLVGFVDITIRYISPDVSPFVVLAGFLIVVGVSARLDSESILYGLEIVLYMTVPLIIYMVWRVFNSPYFEWDAVRQIFTYLWTMPRYQTVAGATFIFTGYINMVIFNRVFKKVRIRHIWLFFIVGLFTLVVSMFAPIGFLGAEGSGNPVYPAFSTVDSLRIRYFIIDRMIYVFYVVYMCLSLMNSIIHWHVSKELIMGAFQLSTSSPSGKRMRKERRIEWGILGVFSALVYACTVFADQFIMDSLAVTFLNIRFAGEFAVLGLMFYFLRKRRRRV
ncbi:GerAB/ArcD/ProY family transporter [Paenibacillus dakarensis]|uniref:GerAB/ArcD/ProY family transporter n=1 Tax=Paenibacillus dakarensis TaxID=1527293 RepID=UPI0006D546F0|nr:GerAB/ArcD/ProY family transporter [Paenibacillus dakarensis]